MLLPLILLPNFGHVGISEGQFWRTEQQHRAGNLVAGEVVATTAPGITGTTINFAVTNFQPCAPDDAAEYSGISP